MSNRRAFTWTDAQLIKLSRVIETLNELREFKPLTLRQIYYQLVGKGYIENNVSQYGMLSKLIKHARIDGFIAWEDVEDRVRAYHDLTGWDSSDTFIEASVGSFLRGYKRDLIQTQEKYLEIWIEKDALSSIFTRVASEYTVPVVVCRGFSSVSFLNDYKRRLLAQRRLPVLLYFGDFDPSGVEMLSAMETTLRDELEVQLVEFKRIGLLKEDIYRYNLPHSPDALKKSDTRAKKHIAEYGELAVELDALPPKILQDKIREAIQNELNPEAFYFEQNREKNEFDKLNRFRAELQELAGKYL
jgi:hypothetical protein